MILRKLTMLFVGVSFICSTDVSALSLKDYDSQTELFSKYKKKQQNKMNDLMERQRQWWIARQAEDRKRELANAKKNSVKRAPVKKAAPIHNPSWGKSWIGKYNLSDMIVSRSPKAIYVNELLLTRNAFFKKKGSDFYGHKLKDHLNLSTTMTPSQFHTALGRAVPIYGSLVQETYSYGFVKRENKNFTAIKPGVKNYGRGAPPTRKNLFQRIFR